MMKQITHYAYMSKSYAPNKFNHFNEILFCIENKLSDHINLPSVKSMLTKVVTWHLLCCFISIATKQQVSLFYHGSTKICQCNKNILVMLWITHNIVEIHRTKNNNALNINISTSFATCKLYLSTIILSTLL